MEVHHHTHAEGKKWTHYLFEFLMLFLAVFAGFLAENQREHFVENKRERTYIRSIAEDLQQEISQLDSILRTRKRLDKIMDSLLYLMNYDDPKQHGNEIYFYTRQIPRTFRFNTNDRTISQLKNAGNWRLIHNQKVSEGLANYDILGHSLTQYIEQREESLVLILYQSIDKMFDNRVFEKMIEGLNFKKPVDNPQLMSYNRSDINVFCNRVHFRKNSNLYFIVVAEKLFNEANKTLALIEGEYHLK
jgi:hypothetical protein